MRFALVTPSFHLDFEICRILIESVHRHVPREVQHFIIVSGDDVGLFRGCGDERTHVIVQEDIVQERFFRVPFARRWRVNARTLPVRGWIWQQMVKLSIANRIDADAYMIIDSDCFFVKDFDPRTLIVDGLVPFYREPKAWYETDDDTQTWAGVSRRLLGLPPLTKPYGVGYVNPWGLWRRDVLLKLQERVSGGHGQNAWLRRVARNLRFSEYALYGMYVDELLGMERSGHYAFGRHMSLDYWGTTPLDGAALAAMRGKLQGEEIVMINAKSHTPVADIRWTFGY